MNTSDRYDLKTIYYHWASVIIILTLWMLGQTIDFFPKGTPRITARSIHIVIGVMFAVIFCLRLNWRIRRGMKLPQKRMVTATHHVLYLLIGLTIVVGVSAVWIRGDNLFNIFQIPAFDPANKPLREEVVDIHGLLANALLIMAGGHGLMALWHHQILKDSVLMRMLPSLKTKPAQKNNP